MEIGALAGVNYEGTVTRCYGTGSVSGEHDGIGGLVGRVETGDVCQCYSTAAVSGGRDTGGLVGDLSYGSITDCYSRGPVNSGDSSGGLLGGGDYPVVSRCYSTGAVSGGALAGGLVGCPLGYPVFASFYDIQTAGKEYSCGLATGLTTAEMQTAATFLDAGWDFIDETENGTDDIWWILEGQDYPRLWWELVEEDMTETAEN